jgi:hypothetical protein
MEREKVLKGCALFYPTSLTLQSFVFIVGGRAAEKGV